MSKGKLFFTGMAACVVVLGTMAMVRYPVGQPVPVEVYTAVMDPCDPIYQVMPMAPPRWTQKLGNNERTRLFFTIDQLIRMVSGLNTRVNALEKKINGPKTVDPNEVK